MDEVRLLEAIGKMMDEKLEKMFDERLEEKLEKVLDVLLIITHIGKPRNQAFPLYIIVPLPG